MGMTWPRPQLAYYLRKRAEAAEAAEAADGRKPFSEVAQTRADEFRVRFHLHDQTGSLYALPTIPKSLRSDRDGRYGERRGEARQAMGRVEGMGRRGEGKSPSGG